MRERERQRKIGCRVKAAGELFIDLTFQKKTKNQGRNKEKEEGGAVELAGSRAADLTVTTAAAAATKAPKHISRAPMLQ